MKTELEAKEAKTSLPSVWILQGQSGSGQSETMRSEFQQILIAESVCDHLLMKHAVKVPV